jgi:hypothetical protein
VRRRIAVPAVLAVLALGGTAIARPGPNRVECEHPRALRLDQYEDGSARLYCGPRLLLRISVPY